MSQDDRIIIEIFEVLRTNGPLDILQVADRVAPKCEVKLSVVERMVRILLEQRQLKHDAEYRLVNNVKSNAAGARKAFGRKTSAGASS